MDQIHTTYVTPATFFAAAFMVSAPLTAFWPWNRVPPRMRTIAGAATTFALTQSLLFAIIFTSYFVPTVLKNWMLPASSVAQLVAIAAIIALILRDQRQVTLDRAELAGEMQAAQQIQQTLVGESVESLRSFRIEVAFHPAREVGGDFYRSRVLPGDRQRILIGDVSGKGAAAAMAATMLMGAAEERSEDSPAQLLAHLNRVLCRARIGGFATCLCADLSADGTLLIANAGHLAPYCNGQEVSLSNGLPLGIAQEAEYMEQSLQLTPGDSLTFISDGVVEARSAAGDLFGFDRTREISSRPAEEIAAAAKQFGQQDDITVLTLSFAG
jgi:serine phosphatase RsbU (regulator of sigma subunit)